MQAPPLPFVGSSPVLTEFLADLDRAAASEVTVLFQGESGVGKTRAARLLHDHGARAAAPFVSVNLAASAPTLIEATLFGHERGAFTDAHKSRPGLFRQADGGTLCLEDVDLLPVEIQGKLLRVLQERQVEPLGGEASVPVDVRVVATTCADLRARSEEGTFRGDLYFRLAVVPLVVPSLRTRAADVAMLAGELARRAAKKLGVPARALSPEAVERLVAHPWPGNVRELENAIERLLVLGPGDATEMPVAADELDFLDEATAGVVEELAVNALRHGLTVEDVTHAMMLAALTEHRGNLSAAARQVGLTRRAFDYRAKQLSGEKPARRPRSAGTDG